MSQQEKKSLKNKKPVQFLILFIVIMAMYFVIEVLPLNVGTSHIPWNEIPQHISKRLPVVVLIALAASAYIVAKNKDK
jgi:hypothetical protein